MSKHRFYIDNPLDPGNEIKLTSKVHYIIHVLRLNVGDNIMVFDGRGHEYTAKISKINKKNISLLIGSSTCYEEKSSTKIRIAQCLIKKPKMDLLLQKTTELGVNIITPVKSEFSVIKIKDDQIKTKKLHWEKITQSACEQSGRNYIPLIEDPISIEKFLCEKNDNLKIMLDPSSDTAIGDIKPIKKQIDILIGPEGGISNNEKHIAYENDFIGVSLGPKILRSETAAIAMLAIIQSHLGDMHAD
jgi:16S rRNA (uracil1498-N3)-methyltransferase